MKNGVWFLISVAVWALLPSCSTLQTFSFDQLQAGEVGFPDAVRKVAVVNNMPVVDADSVDVASEWEGDGKVATEKLAENIANVNYFDEVVICDSAFRANDEMPLVNVVLEKEDVQRLADDLGVDMIFSFDRVHIHIRRTTLLYSGLPYALDGVEAVLSPVVRVYAPNRDKPLFTFAVQDSVSWELTPTLTRQTITRDVSEYAATILVDRLLPHWREVSRVYYDGGTPEMRDAGVCLRENDWEGAYESWKIAYDNKKGQQKMKAAFNIALYYEMKDDIETAKEWLKQAGQLMKPGSEDEKIIRYYSVELDHRGEKISHLQVQMQRFEKDR